MIRLNLKATGVPLEAQQGVMQTRELREVLAAYLETVMESCDGADLPVSRSMVEKLLNTIRSEDFNIAAVESQYEQIQAAMRNELSLRLCLLVDPSKVRYYQEPLEGWREIVERFSDCTRDAEEASKCRALNRHTACVFHCMRVAEVGLQALASALDIPYEYKNWEPVLKKLQYIAETDYEKLEARWKGHREKFLAARERLTAIKDALRNPTMHVRGFFDEEMAEQVYGSVRGFMKNLASWLNNSA